MVGCDQQDIPGRLACVRQRGQPAVKIFDCLAVAFKTAFVRGHVRASHTYHEEVLLPGISIPHIPDQPCSFIQRPVVILPVYAGFIGAGLQVHGRVGHQQVTNVGGHRLAIDYHCHVRIIDRIVPLVDDDVRFPPHVSIVACFHYGNCEVSFRTKHIVDRCAVIGRCILRGPRIPGDNDGVPAFGFRRGHPQLIPCSRIRYEISVNAGQRRAVDAGRRVIGIDVGRAHAIYNDQHCALFCLAASRE